MNTLEFFVVWGRPQAMLTLPGAGEDQGRYVEFQISLFFHTPILRKYFFLFFCRYCVSFVLVFFSPWFSTHQVLTEEFWTLVAK